MPRRRAAHGSTPLVLDDASFRVHRDWVVQNWTREGVEPGAAGTCASRRPHSGDPRAEIAGSSAAVTATSRRITLWSGARLHDVARRSPWCRHRPPTPKRDTWRERVGGAEHGGVLAGGELLIFLPGSVRRRSDHARGRQASLLPRMFRARSRGGGARRAGWHARAVVGQCVAAGATSARAPHVEREQGPSCSFSLALNVSLVSSFGGSSSPPDSPSDPCPPCSRCSPSVSLSSWCSLMSFCLLLRLLFCSFCSFCSFASFASSLSAAEMAATISVRQMRTCARRRPAGKTASTLVRARPGRPRSAEAIVKPSSSGVLPACTRLSLLTESRWMKLRTKS